MIEIPAPLEPLVRELLIAMSNPYTLSVVVSKQEVGLWKILTLSHPEIPEQEFTHAQKKITHFFKYGGDLF